MVSSKESQDKNREVKIIAEEILLVRTLSSNEVKDRNQGIKKLNRWLTSRSQIIDFKEDDFNRLWKGLFYCLWMADKPCYQEEVAERISNLVHCFEKYEKAILFIKSFFNIINQEWVGLDYLRLDKMMMLIRKLIRNSFVLLKNRHWDNECLAEVCDFYKIAISKASEGLLCHILDVYLNELAKIGGYNLSSDIILDLVRPFAQRMATLNDRVMVRHISNTIFLNLISQSDKGLEHQARFKAWRDRGFPGGSIDVIQKSANGNNDSSEEEEEGENNYENGDEAPRVLDPRAGNVNVEVPTLNVNPHRIREMFNELKVSHLTTTMGRKEIDALLKKFDIFSSGDYPLGIHKMQLPVKRDWKNVVRKSARDLIKSTVNGDDDNGNEDRSASSNQRFSNGVNITGQWQVTLKASDKPENNKYNGVVRRSPIKWNVIEKTDNVNNGDVNDEDDDDDKLVISHNDSIHVASKRKRGCVKVKNKNYEESELEDMETTVVIKRPRNNKKMNTAKEHQRTPIKEEASLAENSTPVMETPTPIAVPKSTPSSSAKRKRVYFVLNRNTIQEEREYQRIVRNQPRIKFDSTKQPEHPIYRDRGVRSPINPFYKTFDYTVKSVK